MKKGDIVTINDGSYTRSVVDGKLIKEYLNFGNEKDKHYIIIETDCSFPLGNCQPDNHRNDTVIQAVDGGKVVFIHNCFLKLVAPKHQIWIDVVSHDLSRTMGGKLVEISDELYRKIINES